jgi:hypothetical protein
MKQVTSLCDNQDQNGKTAAQGNDRQASTRCVNDASPQASRQTESSDSREGVDWYREPRTALSLKENAKSNQIHHVQVCVGQREGMILTEEHGSQESI